MKLHIDELPLPPAIDITSDSAAMHDLKLSNGIAGDNVSPSVNTASSDSPFIPKSNALGDKASDTTASTPVAELKPASPKIRFNNDEYTRSAKSDHTANIEDMLKARPAFPPTAPSVFRTPNTNIVTNRQLDTTPELLSIKQAIIDSQIYVTPPKLYIRIIGFRYSRDGEDAATQADMSVMSHDENSTNNKASQKRKKVMDLRVDISKFIDTDYLIYNPESIGNYHLDRRHKHKSLNIYKYVASSKLKAVCQSIKDKFGDEFDHLSVRITNDEFVEHIPKAYKGMFFGEGCSKSLRIAICLAFPPIIPAVLFELVNKKDYDTGFVFRIRKSNIEAIEKELAEVASAGIRDVDPSQRKQENLDRVQKSDGELAKRSAIEQDCIINSPEMAKTNQVSTV
ncbi:hypothetical protein MIR68_005512 [Amoeboaphelidium protococcarum]|nr:hypothetical protein MIR68_005512 [Amoeboaphelidium protococcarum]